MDRRRAKLVLSPPYVSGAVPRGRGGGSDGPGGGRTPRAAGGEGSPRGRSEGRDAGRDGRGRRGQRKDGVRDRERGRTSEDGGRGAGRKVSLGGARVADVGLQISHVRTVNLQASPV